MTHLIHVGNSLGVTIPKAIICQVGFKEETELEFKIVEEGILITPVRSCRKGWLESFQDQKENLLFEGKINNKFDEEWEW